MILEFRFAPELTLSWEFTWDFDVFVWAFPFKILDLPWHSISLTIIEFIETLSVDSMIVEGTSTEPCPACSYIWCSHSWTADKDTLLSFFR